MSEEYKANVDLADVTWPDAGVITAHGMFVDGRHFWLNQQEEGPTLDEIDDMCKRRNFSYYYDDWGPIDQDSRTVLQSMMNEAIARWGRTASEPIPLSERKPGPDDFKNGQAWYGQEQPFGDQDTWDWCYTTPGHGEGSSFTHWLPASTKYLPARVEG